MVRCIFFFLFVSLAFSSPFISDNIFEQESVGSTYRSLLQAKTSCQTNLELQNYTIITSQCKGPQFPPKQCCDAFKKFACPLRDNLNNLESDCASTMFSYINLYGRYPPGLFASQCREGKDGLDCAEFDNLKLQKNTGYTVRSLSSYLVAAICFVLLIQMF
ncbi:hypothetical protein IFM89_012705 [Coptis chinensis]|uniref:GPI-anchored protein LLG1-like domain-containing protein n=1 Tax=Coptis chinensis TaxID=261450 RepID=A0A835IWF6_9MAGN|nr:hypothetical protein IFM89_012705 [Coptis chinensis]